MNTLISIISLIVIYIISTVNLQPNSYQSQSGCILNLTSFSGCSYYGSVDRCNQSILPIDKLPKECSAFFFDGITIDSSDKIHNSYSEEDEKHIKNLANSEKPFIISYGHETQDWQAVFEKKGDIKSEIDALHAYITTNNVTGVLLKNIDFGDNLDKLSGYLKTYAEALKHGISSLVVGLYIEGSTILTNSNCTKSSEENPCFLIAELNEVFDFFSIALDDFNTCSEEYKFTGIAPINGSSGNTLTNLGDVLDIAKVRKDKILFNYDLSPKMTDYSSSPPGCYATINQICVEKDKKETSKWCIDSSSGFYDKGVFCLKHGTGFIGQSIDINDPNCLCECKTPYPSFYFLLDGLQCKEKSTCEAFDRKFS